MANSLKFRVLVGVILLVTIVNGSKISPSEVGDQDHDQPPHRELPSTEWKSLKRSKYLTYLFRKYGSGGMITFEVRVFISVKSENMHGK